jgi:hypothetical protein
MVAARSSEATSPYYTTQYHIKDGNLGVTNLSHKNFLGPSHVYTLWPESANELYRLSNHHLSAKLVPTLADRGCHVVSVTDPYGYILVFLDRTHMDQYYIIIILFH